MTLAPKQVAALAAAAAILAVALGVRQVMGLYLVPMTIEHGWSREAFGFAMAIQNLMWGLMQPFVGGLADRYGSGKVIAAGAALYALGVWGMAGAATARSEEHTSELQSLMLISYAVFCLNKQ